MPHSDQIKFNRVQNLKLVGNSLDYSAAGERKMIMCPKGKKKGCMKTINEREAHRLYTVCEVSFSSAKNNIKGATLKTETMSLQLHLAAGSFGGPHKVGSVSL